MRVRSTGNLRQPTPILNLNAYTLSLNSVLILGLYLCEHECLQGYFETFRAVLNDYGVLEALYADRIGIYFINTKNPENWSIEEQPSGKTPDKTKFGLITEKLGCDFIPAGSPQAKGRYRTFMGDLRKPPACLVRHERDYYDGGGQCRSSAFHQGV
jgi:hypothetical protein